MRLRSDMICAVKTTVNLEETIGKQVGRREAQGTIEEQYRKLVRLGRSVSPGTHLPRGVFYFSSFEDAHQWDWNHIMKRARRISPPGNPTSTI